MAEEVAVVATAVLFVVRNVKTKHNRVEVVQIVLVYVPRSVRISHRNQVVVVRIVQRHVLLSAEKDVMDNVIDHVVETAILHVTMDVVHSVIMLARPHVLAVCLNVKTDVQIPVIIIAIAK
jgi:hypothetical protein